MPPDQQHALLHEADALVAEQRQAHTCPLLTGAGSGDSGDDVLLDLAHAVEHLRAGRRADALGLLHTTGAAMANASAERWHLLGLAWTLVERPDAALDALAAAHRLEPTKAGGAVRYADALRSAGRTAAALGVLNHVVLAGSPIDQHATLGPIAACLDELGRDAEARAARTQAARLVMPHPGQHTVGEAAVPAR